MQLCKGTAVGQEREFETVFFLDNSKLSGPFWCIKITQNRECNYLVCFLNTWEIYKHKKTTILLFGLIKATIPVDVTILFHKRTEKSWWGLSLSWLAWMVCFWVVTFDVPAIVRHHSSVPSSLKSSFHFLNVLVLSVHLIRR